MYSPVIRLARLVNLRCQSGASQVPVSCHSLVCGIKAKCTQDLGRIELQAAKFRIGPVSFWTLEKIVPSEIWADPELFPDLLFTTLGEAPPNCTLHRPQQHLVYLHNALDLFLTLTIKAASFKTID